MLREMLHQVPTYHVHGGCLQGLSAISQVQLRVSNRNFEGNIKQNLNRLGYVRAGCQKGASAISQDWLTIKS